MNKAIIVGYLAADPEYRDYTGRELKMARFRVAVNDMRNFSQTYFFNCIAWNQTADYIGSNLKKGDFVSIDGKLVNRSYVNNDGKKTTTTEIVVESIKNIGSRKTKENAESEEKVSLDKIFKTESQPAPEPTIEDNSQDLDVNDSSSIEDDLTIDWEEDLK